MLHSLIMIMLSNRRNTNDTTVYWGKHTRAKNSLQFVVVVFIVKVEVIFVILIIVTTAATTTAATLLVELGHDRVGDAFEFLLLLLEFLDLGIIVLVEPVQGFLHSLLEGLLVLLRNLVGDTLLLIVQGVAQVVRVAFEGVALVDLLLHLGVLVGEFLGFADHALDLLLGQAALLGGDGDLLRLAGTSVLGGDLEHAVSIDLEGNLDLGHTTGCGRDTVELEFAQQVIVLGHGTLALVHLDHHSRLVVLVRGKRLRFLGGDDGVTFDEFRHHATNSLNAEGQGGNVEQEKVLHVLATFTTKDTALHSSTVGNSLVRVNASVRLLAIEKVLEQLLHLGNTRRATDHHELVDLTLGQTAVVHHVLHRSEGLLEEVHVKLLETRAGQSLGEVDAIVEGLDLQAGLVLR